MRRDRATYALPAADGCTCAWIIATVDGRVQWPDRSTRRTPAWLADRP